MKNKIRAFLVVTSALFLAGTPVWAKGPHSFSYTDQASWHFEAGQSQSPIAINSSEASAMGKGGNIQLDYSPEVLGTDDNSHSIQVDSKGTALIHGRQFELLQVHFHSPSEHTLDGKSYPLEAHFVNRSANGRIAVVGVFFEEGNENSAFQTILAHTKKGERNQAVGKIALGELVPETKNHYHYLGSLTTPPLTENVEWYVMSQPLEVSAQQIEAFNLYYKGNNRELQPLNGRSVLFYAE